MIKLLPLVALFFGGSALSDPAPVLKSQRNFYRSGDSVQVSIVRDTTIDVAFCVQQRQAIFFYSIERLDGEKWVPYYNTSAVCRASLASVMQAEKGFTIKHLMQDKGTYRLVIANVYRSNEFEVR